MCEIMTKKTDIIDDYIIAFAVFIQPILILLQHLLINVFYMATEQTTVFRVLLTALPMAVAILLSVKRSPLLFSMVYLFAFILFVFNILLFPNNEPYMMSEGLRFFLPVVVPSVLCLVSIKNKEVIENVMFVTSIIVAVEVIIYAASLIAGVFIFSHYNMSFSYACLFPMLMLYSRKKLIPIVISTFLFLVVLAIGSRGAAFFYIIYVVIDLLTNRKGNNYFPALLFIAFIVSWSYLGDYYHSLGISSRTMALAENDISHSGGRENIASYVFDQLMQSPVEGLGLFGDRYYLNGGYCHNIFLEILLDFGIILGSIILVTLFVSIVLVYLSSSKEDRKRIIMYYMAFVAPLMFSESYLISNSFFIFIGLLFIIHNNNVVRLRNKLVAYHKK